MNTDQQAILKRLRRKAEILRLDFKSKGDQAYHDMGEILSLIDMLEKNQ
jgi:hypothetical protein